MPTPTHTHAHVIHQLMALSMPNGHLGVAYSQLQCVGCAGDAEARTGLRRVVLKVDATRPLTLLLSATRHDMAAPRL